MPLTEKGRKILRKMVSEYGTKKGKSVFYASENAGRVSGTSPEHPAIAGGPKRMVLRKIKKVAS